MDENFNHEKSLSLISEMIERARNNFQKGGAGSLIYWGYMVAVFAVINCVLLKTLDNIEQSFFIWVLMLPAMLGSYFMERRIRRETLVKTHIDKIGDIIWLGFFISFAVFTGVIHLVSVNLGISQIFMLNIPIIITFLGMGQFITACVMRQKMWYAIAALTWIGAIVCALVDLEMQFIVFAACMLFGFAVPGHILNYQAKKNNV